MWSRKEVKSRARSALSRNYWRCVLVALILTIVLGSTGGTGVSSLGSIRLLVRNLKKNDTGTYYHLDGDRSTPLPDFREGVSDLTDGHMDWLENLDGLAGEFGLDDLSDIGNYFTSAFDFDRTIWGIIAGILIGIGLLISAIGILIRVFLINPLEAGGKRFFRANSEEPARVGELGFAFDSRYMNIVRVMFFRDLFLFLWSLLFVIPGIIKSYSYMLVPYILADHPDMNAQDAITLSRELMHGNKWRAFVLQLSFLGWWILAVLTFGLLGLFYVNPYERAAEAEMYRAIKAEKLQEF